MNRSLTEMLIAWPLHTIRDADLAVLLPGTDAARYGLVKRAFKEGFLVRLRRGVYLIGPTLRRALYDLFAISLQLEMPSYVSLESALSYHGWIPEAVYTTCSVTCKRKTVFKTAVGIFSFLHTPIHGFYTGVARLEHPVRFIADPWKAIADIVYTRGVTWKGLSDLVGDLRIDEEALASSRIDILQELAAEYASPRVRRTLQAILKDLVNLGTTV